MVLCQESTTDGDDADPSLASSSLEAEITQAYLEQEIPGVGFPGARFPGARMKVKPEWTGLASARGEAIALW